MNQTQISIIIPVYNHASVLKQSLHSISEQTYSNIEVIIIDDGSDVPVDEHACKTFCPSADVSVYRQENAGAPAARNHGLRKAKGEYVIFWDADIIAERDMLERMHKILVTHPHISFVYSAFMFGKKKFTVKDFDGEALKKNNYIHSTSLIRKQDVHTWDESLKRFQDWDMWLTMLKSGKDGFAIHDVLFTVIPRKQFGMSEWLPAIAYKKPFCFIPGIRGKVKKYMQAKAVVMKKHGL